MFLFISIVAYKISFIFTNFLKKQKHFHTEAPEKNENAHNNTNKSDSQFTLTTFQILIPNSEQMVFQWCTDRKVGLKLFCSCLLRLKIVFKKVLELSLTALSTKADYLLTIFLSKWQRLWENATCARAFQAVWKALRKKHFLLQRK